MTIDELLSRLKDYREEFGGETEVRLMTQQQWPFENSIIGLCSGAEMNEDDDDDGGDDDAPDDAVVFIVEGGQLRYGSKRAWNVAG